MSFDADLDIRYKSILMDIYSMKIVNCYFFVWIRFGCPIVLVIYSTTLQLNEFLICIQHLQLAEGIVVCEMSGRHFAQAVLICQVFRL